MHPNVAALEHEVANPILKACSETTRQALLARGRLETFGQNQLLFEQGQQAGVVLFPMGGLLQISKTAERGRRQVLCNIGPAGCTGVCLLLIGERGLADARALEAGAVLIVKREDFQELARYDAALCQSVWGAAVQCMEHFGGLVETLSFHKVAERVVLMLLETTEKDGELVRRTQAQLAAEVGTTREVVARCLGGLQLSGAIRLGRGRITVVSREKLAKQI